MEQNQSLFSLSIDPVAKAHFSEAAKWAKFIAIVGMIFVALMVVFSIIGGVFLENMFSSRSPYMDEFEDMPQTSARGAGVIVAVMYIIIAAIYFFPLLFLLRFANRMRAALNANDQNQLNSSAQNLKICFRYIGILTIISLALVILAIIFGVVAGMAFR